MPQCCVPECVNRSETNQERSFYRFPANEKQRLKWLKLLRRKDFIPTCSWHFSNGKDEGPSRFSWNSDKSFNFPNPEPKTHVRRRKRKQLSENSVDENEDDAVQGLLVLADAAASTTILQIEKAMLIKENETLKKELERQKQTFSFKQIENDADKVQYYTGLPNVATVRFLEQLLGRFELTYHSTWTVQMLALVDQLLLTHMKLRLNLGNVDLATRFNCSTATVTNIFTTVVGVLYDILYVGMMENNIPSIAKNQKCLPSCFLPFPNWGTGGEEGGRGGGNFLPVIDQFLSSLEQRLEADENTCSLFGFLRKLESLDCDEIEAAAFAAFLTHLLEYEDDNIGTEHFLYKLLMDKKVADTFPNVEIMLRMYLVLMVTNCSGEPSFSNMKFIKNRLRTTMCHDRLSHLALMSIECDILRD
uniref:uncharacterized protein n=1 Tax=Myxine glutinosa TaxID=7769 RepID=UPI00359029CD